MKDELRFASVSGSHSNQVLRLWYYGCDHQSMGKLGLEQLESRDKGYFNAVVQGCEWDVVSSLVQKTCPRFAELAQAAANAVGQQQRPETELQLCRKVLQLWTEEGRKAGGSGPVEYAKIAPHILKTKPPNGAVLPALYSFILKAGGGSTGHLMKQTEEYVRCYGNAGRALGVPLWEALGSDNKLQPQKNVLWRHALLKALYCHEERLVSASDVKRSLCQKELQPRVARFEAMIAKMRTIGASLGSSHGLTTHDVDMTVGTFEVESVVILLQKKPKVTHDVYEVFEHLEEAAHKVIKRLREQSGNEAVTSPWEAFVLALPAKTESAAATQASKSQTRTL